MDPQQPPQPSRSHSARPSLSSPPPERVAQPNTLASQCAHQSLTNLLPASPAVSSPPSPHPPLHPNRVAAIMTATSSPTTPNPVASPTPADFASPPRPIVDSPSPTPAAGALANMSLYGSLATAHVGGSNPGSNAGDNNNLATSVGSSYQLPHQPVRETHTANVDRDYAGRKTINEYQVLEEIGRGQSGKVKLARDIINGHLVAIKIIPRLSKTRRLGKVSAVDPQQNTKREIAILKKIRHENVVALLEVIDDPELQKIYMVLEHVERGEIVWRKKGLPNICYFERYRIEKGMRGEEPNPGEHNWFDVLDRKATLRALREANSKNTSPPVNRWTTELGVTADDPDNGQPPWWYVPENAPGPEPAAATSPAISRNASRVPSRVPSVTSVASMPTPYSYGSDPASLSVMAQLGDTTPEPAIGDGGGGLLHPSHASSSALDGSMFGAYAEDTISLRQRSPSMAESVISHMSAIDFNAMVHDPYADDFSYVPCFSIEQARSAFRDTVLGLEYLHYHGVVHRDIKPANLLWTRKYRVKISDFGVSYFGRPNRDDEPDNAVSEAEALNFDDDRELSKTVGTPAFFAPELCYTDVDKEPPRVSEQIDVWSLGVTLYCLIFARIPFLAEDEFAMFRKIATEDPYIPDRRLKPVGVFTDPTGSSLYDRRNVHPYRSDANPEYEELSSPLLDLLRKMLIKNPDKRIRLRDVKRHKWVTEDIDNIMGWIDSTDPARSQNHRIQVDEEEIGEAVIPLTFLQRARSAVKKAVGKVIHARPERDESAAASSRRRAASSAASSTADMSAPPYSSYALPATLVHHNSTGSASGSGAGSMGVGMGMSNRNSNNNSNSHSSINNSTGIGQQSLGHSHSFGGGHGHGTNLGYSHTFHHQSGSSSSNNIQQWEARQQTTVRGDDYFATVTQMPFNNSNASGNNDGNNRKSSTEQHHPLTQSVVASPYEETPPSGETPTPPSTEQPSSQQQLMSAGEQSPVQHLPAMLDAPAAASSADGSAETATVAGSSEAVAVASSEAVPAVPAVLPESVTTKQLPPIPRLTDTTHKQLPPLPSATASVMSTAASAATMPRSGSTRHAHSRSITNDFFGRSVSVREARETHTVPATPISEVSTDASLLGRRTREIRSATDASSRAQSVDRAGIVFSNPDKRAVPVVGLNHTNAMGSVHQRGLGSPRLVASPGPSAANIGKLGSPRMVASPASAATSTNTTQTTTTFEAPPRPATALLGERPAAAKQRVDAEAQTITGTDEPLVADLAGVSRPPSSQNLASTAREDSWETSGSGTTNASSAAGAADRTVAFTAMSSSSASLGALSEMTPLTSPSETTAASSSHHQLSSQHMRKDSSTAMLAFQSDHSLPALLSGASSVSADIEGELLGSPGVVGGTSLTDTTSSLTPPALEKAETADPSGGFPLDQRSEAEEGLKDQQDWGSGGAISVGMDNTATKATAARDTTPPAVSAAAAAALSVGPGAGASPSHFGKTVRVATPRRHRHDDDDDDSDSDGGIVMARAKKRPGAPVSPDASTSVAPSPVQPVGLTAHQMARRRDTNTSIGSTDTAKKVPVDNE